MAERDEIKNTIDGTNFGSSLKDLEYGDLSEGCWSAGPEGNYEGSLDSDRGLVCGKDGSFKTVSRGTRHAGHLEADGYYEKHGDLDQWGFVRRPCYDTDVERN